MQGMNPPHLVLCPFAKANWHGSPLAVHTSDLNNTSVQHWIVTILLKYEGMDQDMHYHQAIFITLWTIWTQKPGGPCFQQLLDSSHQNADQNWAHQRIGSPWQLIIKIAGARRSGFAYEAKNMQGVIIFYGSLSCAVGSALIAIQEAMVEAAIKARNFGYSQILFQW